MEELCTLDQAKNVLGVFDDTQDVQITEAIQMASAAVLDYVGRPTAAGLTQIQQLCMRAACLKAVPMIYDGTGETKPDYGFANGELPRAVTQFLVRIKLSSIA